MRKSIIYSGLAAGCLSLMLRVSARAATIYDDDFSGGMIKPQWSQVLDDSSQLYLQQSNDRLQVISNGAGSHGAGTDALYLSNGPGGFKMSTLQDFHISIDYNFTSATRTGNSDDDVLVLDFGVGRDEAGTDSAAIGIGYKAEISFPGAAVLSRTGNHPSDTTLLLASSAGTLDISYDHMSDALIFSTNFGAFDTATLSNLVHGQWNADSLLVSFGARGYGFTTSGDDSYLDNFKILSGRTIAIPEPVPAAFMALASLIWLMDRKRARRRSDVAM